MSGERVSVTGGSGFLGAHTVAQLLGRGYEVHATVRSMARAADARAMLWHAGGDGDGSVSFHVADLASDDSWADAVAGCLYVLHLASPYTRVRPEDPEEPVDRAREGTVRVLRAARDAGVSRVVVTPRRLSLSATVARAVFSRLTRATGQTPTPMFRRRLGPRFSPSVPHGTSSPSRRPAWNSPRSTRSASSARSSGRTSRRRFRSLSV
jgi:uncharacterized protein YbjT (DUF2867 family)